MKKESALLFTGLIFQKGIEEKTVERLSKEFGKVLLKSKIIPFDFTDYYSKEMGERLLREWVLFDYPIQLEKIADIKHKAILIEKEFSIKRKPSTEHSPERNRRINIDPGYVTPSKVVLPTTKDCSHRIYLRDNIFAEVTLIFFKGKWQPQQWTYSDYKTETALNFFNKCREYMLKVKNKK